MLGHFGIRVIINNISETELDSRLIFLLGILRISVEGFFLLRVLNRFIISAKLPRESEAFISRA